MADIGKMNSLKVLSTQGHRVQLDGGDSGEIVLDEKFVFGAMNKDRVLVKITDYEGEKGTIKEILERHGILAEVVTVDNKRCAKIGDKLFQMDIDSSIVDGMLIGVKLANGGSTKYVLDTVLGHKNAPKMDEMKILYDAGIPFEFSKETKNELIKVPRSVSEEDMEGRKDFRNLSIFTIDGDDTKDIDDAISIDKLESGNYKLGVHIADVSHYVHKNSAIDIDAQARCTSVYMPGVVSPMYPPMLSNGICSLNPNVDRLAISCVMEIDSSGKLIDVDIFKSVIHSRKQMTYKKVNKILNDNIVPEGYEDFVGDLRTMNDLAGMLNKSRIKRGMLAFDLPEVKIIINDEGKVEEITKRQQDTGEKLIEDFMLAANECVATYVYNMDLDFVYRVHDLPSEERLKRVVGVIKSYGFDIKTKINVGNPKVIQNLLEEIKDTEYNQVFTSMILRCMAKASYEVYNEGHFGIGINSNNGEAYTHFTSPIRRYPDTMVHRVLTDIIAGDFSKFEGKDYKSDLAAMAKKSSENEVLADRCGREADKMRMAEYMFSFIGEKFKAKIVGFTMHGFFVQLDNLIEGRVGLNTMNDFFNYNEDLEILVGQRSGKVYKLGDEIEVKLVKAEKASREIDFEVVKVKKAPRKNDFKATKPRKKVA
jgi:ribonuclease R